MLDIGSAVSLLCHREVNSMNTRLSLQGCFSIQLVTALRESLPIIDCVKAHVQMTEDDFKANHQFLIVDSLIYPVILGTDFLYTYHLCLDFTSLPVAIQHNISDLDSVQPLWDATVEAKAKRYTTAAIGTVPEHDIVEECSIPHYDKAITYEISPCSDISIGEVLREYKYLFRSIPGATTLAHRHIPTTENPVRVPPQQIPGHYKQEVEQQICNTYVTTRHHRGELQPMDGTCCFC